MIQTFDTTARPQDGPPRLAKLRDTMVASGLDGFLIPRNDAHQGENVAARDERLAWLTGFTGSAGFCVALAQCAAVFIDGRYRVQVKSEIDLDHFTPVSWPEISATDWLKDALPDGGKVGYDALLHTAGQIETYEKALVDTGIKLVASDNLIDAIWSDQPARPLGKVYDYPIEFAGQSSADKRAGCAGELRATGHRAAVITRPDSIAWLLNIRGHDIATTPITLAFAILHDDASVELFSDPEKLSDLSLDSDITLLDWTDFEPALTRLSGPVRVDKKSAPLAVSTTLETAEVALEWGDDPCILPKAIKNPVEITGTRAAHLRDGAAMVEFLAWLQNVAPNSGLSEIDIVTKLEGFRRATNRLVDISFETICGSGANGAIVHYRVSNDSNRTVRPGELVVIDSGGQYLDGTTDITRTVVIGAPTAEQRRCFTLVLQGFIAVSMARWPKGLAGRDLDPLARAPLWGAGLDYDHGTGHGVGVFLDVHEGPQALSKRSEAPLQTGMILSVEPGYYREGAFGIRIENLVVVHDAEAIPGADVREMLDFSTLTYVPIERALVDLAMLSQPERQWLDDYHRAVWEKLRDNLSDDARGWLHLATRPL